VAERAARTEPDREASAIVAAPSPFWSAAALPPLFPSSPRQNSTEREAPPPLPRHPKPRRHSEERLPRRRISPMLPRREQADEHAVRRNDRRETLLDEILRCAQNDVCVRWCLLEALRAGSFGWCGRRVKSGGRAAALQNGLGDVWDSNAPRSEATRAAPLRADWFRLSPMIDGGLKTAVARDFSGSRYGSTVSVRLTLDVAPFGAVAVTTSG
jgi:hypothetical protein